MKRKTIILLAMLFCLVSLTGCKSFMAWLLNLGPCPADSVSLGSSDIIVVPKGGQIMIYIKLCATCPGVKPPPSVGVKGKLRLQIDEETLEDLGVAGEDIGAKLAEPHELGGDSCTKFTLGPYSSSYKQALVGVEVELKYADKETGEEKSLGEIEIRESPVEPSW